MKVGGNRNFGYGKSFAWAGKNALRDRYGQGHFGSQAAHAARWRQFVEFAKQTDIRDARNVTREFVQDYASSLAAQVESGSMSIRYAQNLVSTVNVVLETMRGDRELRLSPARLLGQRVNVRQQVPASLDRRIVGKVIERLERRGHDRVAAVALLARELGLRFREASLLDARTAYRQALETGRINVTRGTKGGRGKTVDRWVPVTPGATVALARAKALQEDRANLSDGIPLSQWRAHANGTWRRAASGSAMAGFHDLRVAYACERYQALTGVAAPVVAGKRIADRESDRAARAIIATELGHGRIEVVASYCGSSR
jgi:hypothetical protein